MLAYYHKNNNKHVENCGRRYHRTESPVGNAMNEDFKKYKISVGVEKVTERSRVRMNINLKTDLY